ncbi:PREDICTED: condensin-2 complex subunit H2 [Calidris pugnax]|uniref:condensin-2 complex subunit H2 n=1 Tax=Calidris pugnax TaxID=198806 RepID=UPI00071C792F|nr:PREDICTED: condensin-2 complex subunit H2 [Calidris pugnax]
MEEVESRFLHLLQPIRDLTKNWEVDVAAQLGEYLEELDQICISFDDGKTTMNFIEAALVIQGSACVYSRKVEYLYSLVYQTLDFISNKKREKLPSSVGQDGRDTDATFGGQEQEEFLSLDDIRDSSQASVDMRKDHQPNAVDIIPLTPMSLVLPEEAEKRDNPLFSRRGEVLASRKDFRMNTCTPHATGAFLLELAGLSPTARQHRQRTGSPGTAAAEAPSGILSSGADPVQALSFSADEGAAEPDGDDSRGDAMPGGAEDDVEMIPAAQEHKEAQRSAPQPRGYVLRERAPAEDPAPHIKVGGEVLDPWQSLDPFADSEDKPFKKGRPFLVPHGLDEVVGGKRKRKGPRKLQDFVKWFSAASEAPSGILSSGADPVQALSFSADEGAAEPDGDDSRGDAMPGGAEDDVEMIPAAQEHKEAQRSAPQPRGYVLRERAPAEDPAPHIKEVLDPWQSLDPFADSEDKPFKKGRPFLVPHGLDEVVGGKRKRKGPRKLQDFVKWFSAAYSGVAESRKTRRKGPTFADLEVLYWRQLKERMAAQRKLQSRAGLVVPPPPPCEEEVDVLEEERGADCDEGADDFVEHEDIQPEALEELGEGDAGLPDLGSLAYEELVRRNVELFMANSQKYAQETELSQHIRRWEDRMGPMLQEQARNPPFSPRAGGGPG